MIVKYLFLKILKLKKNKKIVLNCVLRKLNFTATTIFLNLQKNYIEKLIENRF